MLEDNGKHIIIWVVLNVALLQASNCIGQEQLFHCKPVKDGDCWISECDYFYNFITGQLDSLSDFVSDTVFLEGYDTLLVYPTIKVIKKTTTIKYCEDRNGMGQLVYFDGNKKFMEASTRDGELDGELLFYLPSDTIRANFLDDKVHGTVVTKLNDYKLYDNYSHGLLDGPSYTLDEFEMYSYFTTYKNGLKNGLEFKVHGNGMLHYQLMYKDGKIVDGTYYVFLSNGDIDLIQRYEDGKVVDVIDPVETN